MVKALNTQPQRSGSSVSSGGRGNNNNWIIQILFVAFILCFISFNSFYGPATLQHYDPAGLSSSYGAIGSPVAYQQQQPSSPYGLHVNEYPAVALPSVRTSEEEETKIERKFYGGAGDKAHLGGFTAFDPNGVSPTLWTHMVSYLGIKSLLDVVSTKQKDYRIGMRFETISKALHLFHLLHLSFMYFRDAGGAYQHHGLSRMA